MLRDFDQLPGTNGFPSYSQGPTSTQSPEGPSVSVAGLRKVPHPNPSKSAQNCGHNLLQHIDQFDQLAERRSDSDNIFYPFSSRAEWQLARWLTKTSLPQSEVNEFLHLDWVRLSHSCLL